MKPSSLEFLKNGGEVGERMRLLDWSATPVGAPDRWPQSLKTIVRVMLDSRFAMWMMWGEAGTFFCNDAYLPTVGIKREWVLGARADKVWEEIWPTIWPRIDHVLRTGQATFDEDLRLFLRRSGYPEETFHTFSYGPVYDDTNRVAGMLCVVTEDTTRVIGERRLRTLRDLAALSTGAALSIDEAGQLLLGALALNRADVPFAALYLVDVGPPVARLVGCNAAERSGLPEVLHLAQPDIAGPLGRAMQSGHEQLIDNLTQLGVDIAGPWTEVVQQALVVPLRGSGQARSRGALVLGVSPRRQLDVAYRSFLTLVADQFSSALRETRARLDERQRAQALAELDQAKNVFFGNVSHEFRTPLTLMLGPVDNLLARGSLPPDVTESLRLVQRNGMRLRKLVNSLLDFSRIEAGKVDAKFQPTDLAAFTLDLVSVFRSAIEGAGLRLFAHFARLPEPVFVDREMWEKIVLNLLSNALKYTLEGDIEVVLAVSGSEVHLGVRDTGVGIDAQELPHVFDRFHRVPGTRGRSQEGTGIGLALLRELVKLHGGEVAVVSQLGKGTCFTVSIPLGSAHLPKAQVDLSATPASATIDATPFVDDALRSEGSGSPKSVRGRGVASRERENILVVDDNADMRLYLERIFEPYWSVTTAANGLDAVAAMERVRPDLVVTDMNMPGLNGRGLIQHIRTHSPAMHTLPVLVLSAQAGDDQKVAGLNQGADDYLVKPFSTRELLARVEVQLLRARARAGEGLPDADSPIWLEKASRRTNGQRGGGT